MIGLSGKARRAKKASVIALILAAALAFPAFSAYAEETKPDIIVQIVHDGKHSTCETFGDTVENILEDAEITLGEHDLVSPHRTFFIRERTTITITRREIVTREETEVIPNKTVEIPTSLLKKGERMTMVHGGPGAIVTTYSQMYEEGKPLKEEVEEKTELVKEPVTSTVLVGQPGAAVSPLKFDTELDQNGIPKGYASVMTGQRAAGYSAGPGAGTASGRPAAVGHVAVNPNVIPYGTKLYIRSADGNFVYGYAIAADTGAALMQGVVTLDLFYATYAESALNGIKTVDIYILNE